LGKEDPRVATDLFTHIGSKLRELRAQFHSGRGLSQEALAEQLKVSPNSISRWESASYHPTMRDLDHLARFFGVSILVFFPDQQLAEDEMVAALLRGAKDLDSSDRDKLRAFAEFRKAQAVYRRAQSRVERTRPNRRVAG
jgi:transcriptional regulator with XRE-family HTH domain